MTERLIGSYASLTVHDPKTFTAELIVTLMRYPASVAEYGINAARKASPQYIPSIPQIENACEQYLKDTTKTLTYASEWNHRAKEQLAERQEIDEKAEPVEYRKQVAERILADYKSKLTPEPKPPAASTWRQFTAEELLAKYPPRTDVDEPSP
jgi:hypothetical protein